MEHGGFAAFMGVDESANAANKVKAQDNIEDLRNAWKAEAPSKAKTVIQAIQNIDKTALKLDRMSKTQAKNYYIRCNNITCRNGLKFFERVYFIYASNIHESQKGSHEICLHL